MSEDMIPDLPETDGELSNFDFSIDGGVEEALVARTHIATYSGWNFNGKVWHDGSQFVCLPWTYRSPNESIMADTLVELMHAVSAQYGYE